MVDDTGLSRSRSDNRLVVVSVVVGVAVAVVTGGVASAFLFAATWAGIHGGLSEITLAMFSLGTFAAPLTLGVLAGWGTYHLMGKRGRPR